MIVDVRQRRGETVLEVVSSFRCLGKPLSVTFAWIDNTSCLVPISTTGAQSWPASTGVENFPVTGINGWNRRRELCRGWWRLHTPRIEGPRSSQHHRGRKRATNIAKGTSHSPTPTLCPCPNRREHLEPLNSPLQINVPFKPFLQILCWNNNWIQFLVVLPQMHNCVCASNMWERPFPQLSFWALAAKVWQLIWPHVLGEIMGGKCKEDQSETGRPKKHERHQIYSVTYMIYSAFGFICFNFFLFLQAYKT